jgi:hypothetical protein
MKLRRKFTLLPLLGLLFGSQAAPIQAASRVEYRDNSRPIELHLPFSTGSVRNVQVTLPRPRTGELRIEIGPQGPRTLRAPSPNPTLRARAEGKPLPVTAYVGLGIGRFGRTQDQRLALYWAREDHFGMAYWPPGTQDRGPLHVAATFLEQTFVSESPRAWLEYAASLEAGSRILFQPRAEPGLLYLFGGTPEAARLDLDQQLDRIVAAGKGWRPLRGTHSPAFLGSEGTPFRAVLVAGPLLLCVSGPEPESTLKRLASWIHRPLPPAPVVQANPMAP